MRERPFHWLKQKIREHGIQGRVLDIGSKYDRSDLDMRTLFSGVDVHYTGIDLIQCHGVDLVMDAKTLHEHFNPGYFDCVCCCNILEHDPQFWLVLRSLERVLHPHGWLILVVPSFGEQPHMEPNDFYRFDENSVVSFFDDYDNVELMGGDANLRAVGGIGKKPELLRYKRTYSFFDLGSYSQKIISMVQ